MGEYIVDREKNSEIPEVKNGISERNILSSVNSPEDLKKLDTGDIAELSDELRGFITDTVVENGGHLASNLGTVEMTIAMLRVFDVPKDHIIFDVGHQAYTYKILTGRRDRFHTLRQSGGISGFPKRDESEYDCFGTGHSSTSLSAALGFAHAEKLNGSDSYTVAVVGDGAFTGGMVHEALNNCLKDLHLIIILNENEMSISKNIGSFARNLSRMRSKTGYFRAKSVTRKIVTAIPLIGRPLFELMRKIKRAFKNLLYGSNYFEDMGLYYLGPVDGNNEEDMEELLREAVKLGESVIIHAKTKKGKGIEEVENNPWKYHGVPPKNSYPKASSFSDKLGEFISEIAEKNDKIIAITAAMSYGTGIESFHRRFPDRFFDVGIAEEHAVTFAAGLCAAGYRPIVPIYSTFMQRAYDNIIHDVALQHLPVVFCSDRAGLNSGDGATHHGIFDVAFFSEIPGVRIYTPITFKGLKLSLDAALADSLPSVIRYPNSGENEEAINAFYGMTTPDTIGIRVCGDITSTVLITHGRIVSEVMKARRMLSELGVCCGIILAEFIRPFDTLKLKISEVLPSTVKNIIFVEEEIRNGGFGMIMTDRMTRDVKYKDVIFTTIAPDDNFVIPKAGESLYHAAGISAEQITDIILSRINI